MTSDPKTPDTDAPAADEAELSDDQLEAAAGGTGPTGVWAGEDGKGDCTSPTEW